eukprot:TRINITY_DN22289_c0_g1_i1.p1 TRINITY_DN22289_c0_g1~~TRINITY_DN22289_c0_g1_i1.p1  ORF type:complete len:1350 (+),score=415.96 TRINITY_DN22289_c0_g1_i1:106-4050(+)
MALPSPQRQGGPAPQLVVSPVREAPGLEDFYSVERPKPALALYGCPELHAGVEKSMGRIRQDSRLEFVVRCLSTVDEIRCKKEERKAFKTGDGRPYVPRGIMKAGWWRKHQQQVFGCVLLLLDAGAQHETRDSFEAAALALLEPVKSRLRGRLTKVLVVVVTRGIEVPLYERFEDMVSALRKKLDLDSVKNVCQLNRADHDDCMKGMVRTAHELALNYYREEARRVKKLKGEVSQSTQPFLFARHRFKIGFLYEVQQHSENAKKYYEQSYNHVRTVSCDTFSPVEVKAVADAVMFRLALTQLQYGACSAPSCTGANCLKCRDRILATARAYQEHMLWFRDCNEHTQRPLRAQRGGSSAHRGAGGSDRSTSPRVAGSRTPTLGPQSDAVSQSSMHSGAGVLSASAYSAPSTRLQGSSTGPWQPGASAALPPAELPPGVGLSSAAPEAVLLHHATTAASNERFAALLAAQPAAMAGERGGYYDVREKAAFHYHAAGVACRARRAHSTRARELYYSALEAAEPAARPAEYIGQPWEGAGGERGAQYGYLAALLAAEEAVPHKDQEIALCRSALALYGSNGQQRLTVVLALTVAECLCELERWADAAQELAGVAEHVHHSEWPLLHGHTLRLQMQCSLNLGSASDYFRHALLRMGSGAEGTEQLYEVVVAWARSEAAGLQALGTLPPPAGVPEFEVDETHPFLAIHADFTLPTAEVMSPCVLRCRLSTRCPFRVQVGRLLVSFRDGAAADISADLGAGWVSRGEPLSQELQVTFAGDGVVALDSVAVDIAGGALRLRRRFGDLVELRAQLSMLSGPGAHRPDTEVTFPGPAAAAREQAAADARRGPSLCGLRAERPAVRVLKRLALLKFDVRHAAPAMLGEAYALRVAVTAGEDAVVSGTVRLSPAPSLQVLRVARGGSGGGHVDPSDPAGLQLERIPANGEQVFELTVRSCAAGDHELSLTATYATEVCSGLTVQHSLQLSVVVPFELRVTVTDTFRWDRGAPGSGAQQHAPLCGIPRRSFCSRVRYRPAQPPADGAAPELDCFRTVVDRAPCDCCTGEGACVHVLRHGQAGRVSVAAVCAVETFGLELQGLSLEPNAADGVSLAHPAASAAAPGWLPCELSCGEEFAASWTVRAAPPLPLAAAAAGREVSLGAVRVSARRLAQDGAVGDPVEFTLPLDAQGARTEVVHQPVEAMLRGPSIGQIGRAMPLTLALRNNSDRMQEVQCDVTDSRGFFWAGRSSWAAQVLPWQEAEMLYSVIPLQPGTVALPSFGVRTRGAASEWGARPVVSVEEKVSVFIYPGATDALSAGHLQLPLDD